MLGSFNVQPVDTLLTYTIIISVRFERTNLNRQVKCPGERLDTIAFFLLTTAELQRFGYDANLLTCTAQIAIVLTVE